MQLIWCLLSNFYLNMFRASICPSSGEQDCVLPHILFCTGCAGCSCVELGRELCALCEGYCSLIYYVFFWVVPRLLNYVCSSYHLPMKVEQIECSETSAYIIHTPGNYAKENIIYSEHDESLKSRILFSCSPDDGNNDARKMLR